MNRLDFIISSLMLAFVAANPAHAQWSEPASEVVSYADLDLSTPAGIKTLDGRIDRAVRKLCGKAYMDLATPSSVRRCRKDSLARAQSQRSQALASAQSIRFSARER